ncbi:HAMP domain-containing histidine kinase [Clostridium gasigenes]|uniref:sensor histidine kinase n=1 Tax=Clostridium gasigenes TaxID=94869 RepID=UPI0014384971|nr:HAMP domain-containing sensor histidine kinase [Clostridium gasigenes]NKF06668.1 HAMP domain-containing histidine kinase [Clostridium gasigenes]QSW20982.1 HAMP domain-containing histidine kinase [Clostridium gasigenes]
MKNFINPELKKSALVLIGIEILLLVFINIGLSFSFNNVKNNYIESKSALIGVIANSHPELSEELLKLTFKNPTKEELDLGKSILKEYGYSENLEIDFVEGLNKSFYKTRKLVSILVIIFSLSLLILNYIEWRKIFDKIRNLTKVSNSILEENYQVEIYEHVEGDFAKLAHKSKEMRKTIKTQIGDLNKEKEFLVNLLSDISHQLNTPLASLVVFNDILSKKNITEENREKFLVNSRTQLNRMEWLIKSLLKLAKVDARAITFNIKENNLNSTIEESLNILENMAIRNMVKLEFIPLNIDIKARYDNEWISEALINIIKNAIEHSSGGQVLIEIEDNPITTKIIIRDNGVGISEKDFPNIFKRFYKGGKKDSVGIGLALSKSIIEAHGGFIDVNSQMNEGTEFCIVLVKGLNG